MKSKSFNKIVIFILSFVLVTAVLYIFTYKNTNENLINFARTTINIKETTKLLETATAGQWYIPKINGQQSYCIEPGGPVKYSRSTASESDIMQYVGKTFTSECGPASKPKDGAIAGPVYTASGGGDLTPELQYVFDSNASFADKQRALWNSREGGHDGGMVYGTGKSQHDGSSSFDDLFGDIGRHNSQNNFITMFASLTVPRYGISSTKSIQLNRTLMLARQEINNGNNVNTNSNSGIATISNGSSFGSDVTIGEGDSPLDGPANAYGDFMSKVQEDGGLNIQDKTDYGGLTIHVNQDTGIYTVGPFNITYNSGGFGNEDFSGMTDFNIDIQGAFGGSSVGPGSFGLVDPATGEVNFSEPDYFEGSGNLGIDNSSPTFPASGQDFYVTFSDPIPDTGFGVVDYSGSESFSYSFSITWTATYQWTEVHQGYTEYTGALLQLGYDVEEINPHYDEENGKSVQHYGEKATGKITKIPQQHTAIIGQTTSITHTETITGGTTVDIGGSVDYGVTFSMELGGNVWEDGVATKEGKIDGVNNTTGEGIDLPLANIPVTIHVVETGEQRTTLTDANGNYKFTELSPMKKFYVTFEYNGQTYIPTEYLNTASRQYPSVTDMVKDGKYNTDEWKVSSKATEEPSLREAFDKKFEEIRSYPENYKTSNSLGKVGNYNATYSKLDLMGYTLGEDGKYKQTGTQLIDGYLYDENGLETKNYSEGIITKKIKEKTGTGSVGAYYEGDVLTGIYSEIAGNDMEMWRKLQFIEDCTIEARTQSQGGKLDPYPVWNQFYLGDEQPGQDQVNLGLSRRPESDASIRKDLYKAALKINDKTVVYNYDKRAQQEDAGVNSGDGKDNNSYWDINVRMSDYDAYYGTGYNRELYKSDVDYKSVDLQHPGSDLQVFVTYKITVRNQSQTIMNQIKEVVDFYDADYEFREDLSWVTYSGDGLKTTVSDEEYYNAMVAGKVGTENIKNARPIKSSSTSKYGTSTHSDITDTGKYKAVYIQGLEDKKLGSGASGYIYLTFEVGKDENGRIKLDTAENDSKQNLVEINGFSTYYRNDTKLPNGVNKSSEDIAGLLDRDSNPGNLIRKDIENNDKYEKNFEDDTDRAKSLRILVDENAVRKVNGTVWEDERTTKSGDSVIGDGIRQKDEQTVAGVTVQLVEKIKDGSEYIWQEVKTDKDGKYELSGFIPGDYVVRFYYGESEGTVKVKGNGDYTEGGLNDVSYNGQDFKSTTYQKGINQVNSNKNPYGAYTDANEQNKTGTYGYNIFEADNNKNNVSDAKDLWSGSTEITVKYKPNTNFTQLPLQGRQSVIDYSKDNVTNHIAEVLASPYETPTYNDTKYTKDEMASLLKELMDETYMTAETGVFVAEFEYDRYNSDGEKVSNNNVVQNDLKNDVNGNYTLANVDLGLTERPKAQLEIDKSIANVKVTLANGNVLFDANEAQDDLIWQKHKSYELDKQKDKNGVYEDYYGQSGKNRYSYREKVVELLNKKDKGLIQISMDEEIMQGATIQITYKIKAKNVGEVDYEGQKFYYLGDASGANKVTTVANEVMDYVANNLQFDIDNKENASSGWQVVDALGEKLVNDKLSEKVRKLNTIIKTEKLNKKLTPGEETDVATLILSRIIAADNKADDLTYSNTVEIAKISNTVGRRMAFSVVGNQDPENSKAQEVDTSLAERVVILPPFGSSRIVYYTIGLVIAIILTGGIAFIIKKVLKK